MTFQRLISPTARCLLALSLVLCAGAASADERSGTFKTLEGSITLVRGERSLPAVPGGALREGDRIVTGANSAAAFALADGTVISVGPNTSLDLTHFVFDPTSQNGSLLLNLLQGTVRMITGIMGKTNPELVRVTTPTTVVGVRGTDFIVEALP